MPHPSRPSTSVDDLPSAPPRPTGEKPLNKWPVDWTNHLLRLHGEGLSISKIAAAMNLSRGTVSGKLHRLFGYTRASSPPTGQRARSNPYFETWAARKARLKREREKSRDRLL